MRPFRATAATTDDRVLQALSRGPLTTAQLASRLGFSRYGLQPSLERLTARGAVVRESADGLVGRVQFRAVRA